MAEQKDTAHPGCIDEPGEDGMNGRGHLRNRLRRMTAEDVPNQDVGESIECQLLARSGSWIGVDQWENDVRSDSCQIPRRSPP